MLIIELNEFCPKYLAENAEKLNLENIKKILKFNHSSTISPEKKEFEGLDPWVQWVSIHNGISFAKHGIKNLGQNNKDSIEQIWNSLSYKKNITWIVHGAINSRKGSDKGCISYFPDPWSSEEKASSRELNDLLELPRYISKNYLSLNYFIVLKKSIKTFRFFIRRKNLNLLYKTLLKLFQSIINPGINIHTLTSILDYVLVLYFVKEKNNANPNLSIIFLNHIAHLQHHFWIESQNIHPQMIHGMRLCDEIIKLLLNSVKDKNEKILLINALKQKRSDKNGIQVYRQKNPLFLLNILGIKNVTVEQNMTNDGTLIFKSISETKKAFDILKKCHLNTGEKLFRVETVAIKKIFIKLNLNHLISKDVLIISGKKSIPFYDLFKNLSRTGSHIPQGDIFSKNMQLPSMIENHEIHEYIKNSFN